MKDERERPAGYVRMTKERFVERMRADADAAAAQRNEAKRRARSDMNDYLHERLGHYLHKMHRKTLSKGGLH